MSLTKSIMLWCALALVGAACSDGESEAEATPETSVAAKSETAPPAAEPQPAPAASAPAANPPESAGVGVGASSPPPPRLTADEAQKLLTAAATEGARGGDCTAIMKAVNTAAAVVGPTTAENQSAFLFAALCGERTGNFRLMLWAASALAEAKPETLKLGIIPRALMHLKQPGPAYQALQAIDKRYPNEPGVLFAGMLLAADQGDWKGVLKVADRAVARLAASSFKAVAWQAEAMRAKAYLKTAQWKKVERSIAAAGKLGAPPEVLALVAKKLIPVRQTRVYVDPDVPDKIYLGTYHLYGKGNSVGDAFTVEIANLTGADQSMKVELEIPGVTDRTTTTVNILRDGHEKVTLTPPLGAGFQPATQQAERTAQVQLRVTLSDGKVVFDESLKTRLYPRDQLPLRDNLFIPAWITPQAPAVEQLLTAAKKRAGGSLPGNLAPTLPQVKALYDELKARGMSYVLVTNFGVEEAQHTRLPADTIASTNALCLDGTILFATLAEKLGLRPVLVRIPGHIFFGWHAEAADKAKPGTIFFVETTMVGTHSFEQAVQAGQKQFEQQVQLRAFQTGQSAAIDVLELRKAGITPQPWG